MTDDNSESQAELTQLLVDDPHLFELLAPAKAAFDDLAAYMTTKCQEAGIEVPGEWLDLVAVVDLRCRWEKKGDLVQSHSTEGQHTEPAWERRDK